MSTFFLKGTNSLIILTIDFLVQWHYNRPMFEPVLYSMMNNIMKKVYSYMGQYMINIKKIGSDSLKPFWNIAMKEI